MKRDLNAVEGIIGGRRVLGIDQSGDKLVKLCDERGMIVGNMWFKNRYIYS